MLLFFFLWASSLLFSEPSIAFIHLGGDLPEHLTDAVAQARLFNPSCPIYLVANQSAWLNLSEELSQLDPICVSAESLPRTEKHSRFLRMTRLDRESYGGFWLYTTERFFYLFELMKQFDLTDVFHLEYDNMLYADVSKLLPSLNRHYEGKIAATFDNDKRCIAGFMYIADPFPLEKFLEFVVIKAYSRNHDMEFLAEFKGVEEGAYIDHLPIVIPAYAEDRPLISPYKHQAKDPALYSRHFADFQTIFDAAALGQYLGGISPRNGPPQPGFINESCVFNPSLFSYEWIEDEEGRFVPTIVYRGQSCPIVNLHIHCKNLKLFGSRR